jgi:hypothetical protein
MAQGPNEARFRTSLQGASAESVQDGAKEWLRCAELLDVVSRSLQAAADKDQRIGGRTGPAMGAAFRRTSKSVGERAGLLREGKAALESAAQVIEKAVKAQQTMDQQHPAGTNPGTWNRPVGPLTEEDLEAQRKHQARVNEYQENYAARERISQQWTENIDNVFADSTEVMKKIHGEPDPEPPQRTGEGKPGSIIPTRGRPQGPGETDTDPRDPDGDPRDPDGDPRDPDGDPRDPDDTDPRDPDGDPRDPDDSGGDDDDADPRIPPIGSDPGGDGGVSTGTLGGLAVGAGGGALALGGLRNGGLVLPGGAVNSNGVRPIGSTGRIGTSGALGRGAGALAPGSPVTRGGAAAGRGGVGRGAAGTGSPVGRAGRGGAGGRGAAGRGARAGAGGIGTGRGKGKKDEEKKQAPRDLFDDGEDWIDDEGAAPDVLS